ncbi:MAG TPA: class I SAM-dependent methyltransferase [Pyrinomonadaceae bacterium]|nr:class I SAM-dependent methyltransferase [Pyrinomonadaceae bacterium]
MEDKALTAEKFTALSRGWSEHKYGDPAAFMKRRAALVRHWGTALRPGDRLLELGCGDGALSCLLAREGFEVTGVDISRGMIEEAQRRADREAVEVSFELADSDHFEVAEPYDGVVSFMGAFFTYLENPARFIETIQPFVRKKIILDWNFHSPCTFVEAAEMMRGAGLQRIEWRPWFVPYTTVAPPAARLRGWVEGRPNLSLLLLNLKRWHYTIYLKGENGEASVPARAGAGREQFHGNRLPGSFLQRSLVKLGQVTR